MSNDYDENFWPNGGKPLLLRMSKDTRRILDELVDRTNMSVSDCVRTCIEIVYKQVIGELDMVAHEIERLWHNDYDDELADKQREMAMLMNRGRKRSKSSD